jgi:DNA-binding transcriptional MerR regulator
VETFERPSAERVLIGDAVRLTGASAKAIRTFEAIGLLPQVMRKGTYRTYGSEDLAAILLIRRAQRLGFTLVDLRELGQGQQGSAPSWDALFTAITARRAAIAEQRAALARREAELAAFEAELAELRGRAAGCDELSEAGFVLPCPQDPHPRDPGP